MKEFCSKHPWMVFFLVLLTLITLDSVAANCCKAYVMTQAIANHAQVNITNDSVSGGK